MTEAIELGQRRQWRHTARLSTIKAHDPAAQLASRARAEAEATSSRYGRSGKGYRVPCPRSTLARARRTTMWLSAAYALRARRRQAAVVARDAPRRLAPGPQAADHPATLRHVHARPAVTRAVRWVGAVALVAMLLGVGVGADAKDCSHATLLPVDTTITPPAADVPADLAPFSGAWGGAWTDRAGRPGACTALVVEDVFANGYVRVVYSVGVVDPHIRQPRYWRAAGRVIAGTLRFELPTPTRPEVTYRMAGNDLAGTFRDGTVERLVTVTRLPDLHQVRCPRLPPVVAPTRAARDRLLATELLASTWAGDGPVHNDYFMPMAAAAPARHTLRGSLTMPVFTLFGAHQGCTGLPSLALAFAAAFFTHGDHLVPVVRTIVWSSDGRLGLILSPGRVWSGPGDQGLSRASFPFVLVNPIDNSTHNGLASFVFDDTRVSNLRVQLTQETARWWRHDYWGQVPLTYAPGAIADEARLRAEFDLERRLETPVRPWSALPATTPSPWLDAFDGSAAPDDVSASGLVIDGVLYMKGCHTRSGPHPYCRHMRHGAYSVTKSLGAAVALLRLAAKYGDGVLDATIADYVR
jgi:hypothetical protein